jgi:4-hydroxy-tetrahydrodipicolinate synthase
MLTRKTLRGVIPAIVTPFTAQDEVDEAALGAITEFVVKNGAHAIMTTGGTGEFPHLSRDERAVVTRAVVQASAGRVPVIAGTAACSTREALELTEDAARAGAQGAIVVSPFYFGLPERALYKHFADLAEAAVLPIVLYNNPLYTGNHITPSLVAELAQLPGIIGLKQSDADMGKFVEIKRLVGDSIAVCTGIDSQFYPALCVGGVGIFSTAASVIPRQIVDIWDAFQRGDHAEALAVHMKVQVLNRFLEYDPGYVAPCKEALRLLGLPGGPVRPPLPELTAEEKSGIADALRQLGLL